MDGEQVGLEPLKEWFSYLPVVTDSKTAVRVDTARPAEPLFNARCRSAVTPSSKEESYLNEVGLISTPESILGDTLQLAFRKVRRNRFGPAGGL
jgi:hypothetical protein